MGSRVITGAVIAILAVGLVGCSGATPRASPTPTPPFANADAAYRAAEATYRGYVEAFNAIDLDDPTTFSPVYEWLSGPALDADRKEITAMAARHLRIVGRASVKSASPVKGGDALWGDVAIEACHDVHAVDVLDSTGASLVEPDRPDVERVIVRFVRDGSTSSGMRIIQMKLQEDTARCAR